MVVSPAGVRAESPSAADRQGRWHLPGWFRDQATPIAEPPSPPDMGRLMALAERHGIEIHGPLPELPAEFGAVRNRVRANVARMA